MFVGTFLIGLREGLEATLIVGIVGAFLRRNGASVRPMMAGVAVAVTLSIAVGVGLDLLSTSLPQRQQEMLETVIGAAAVVFVTTMIIWMNRHAVAMKGELEDHAARAIGTGSSLALAGMAFLAVLKEGFETAVFLLAAAQATHGSRWAALLGGLSGIAVAVGIGVGIYLGGIKLNLARFFRVTGVFLVFVAAGLVLNTLRTAHEAGWLTVGQDRVADLTSWLSARSVLGAVATGMFGIPVDPRQIEVIGWALYAVPVLAVFLWPATSRRCARTRRRVLLSAAIGLAVAAGALALLTPGPRPAPGATRAVALTGGGTTSVTVRVADGATLRVGDAEPVALTPAGTGSTDGVATQLWQARVPADPGVNAPSATLADLARLTGGRLPVGLGANRAPGPFQASWSGSRTYQAVTHGDSLISARSDGNRIAVLSGGGLTGNRTVSLGALPGDWATPAPEDDAVAAALAHRDVTAPADALLRLWAPILLAVAAVGAAATALRPPRTSPSTPDERHGTDDAAGNLAPPPQPDGVARP